MVRCFSDVAVARQVPGRLVFTSVLGYRRILVFIAYREFTSHIISTAAMGWES